MWRDLNREDPSPQPPPDFHMQNTLEALEREPFRGFPVVLELEGRIDGYALLISFWSNELGGELCEVDELYVKESSRGRGYGQDLIEAVKSGSGIWPRTIVAVHLEVSPENQRARDLYERLGFRPVRNSLMRLNVSAPPENAASNDSPRAAISYCRLDT